VALLACAGPSAPPEAEAPEVVTVSTLVADAEEARDRGDLDTAIDAYAGALERSPWNDRLRRTLAATYAERARRTRAERGVFGLEPAERDLRQAVQLDPELPDARQNLAVLILERAVREMDPERGRALRKEAYALDPELRGVGEGHRADVERRLDLAYELVQRGQIDAGIERLELLHAAHPEHTATTRLLGQALAHKARLRAERGRHEEAGALLDRAVGVYAELFSGDAVDGDPELRDEFRGVHRSRIVSWINAGRRDNARTALSEAEGAGFEFPDLRRALRF
jgi:tetratricopeptide (TPR) repeat protein